MGVTAWTMRDADAQVILQALKDAPSIIVDCANAADPHRYLPWADADSFDAVQVISIDLLYSLPDVLRAIPRHLRTHDSRTVCVTSMARLYTYHDEEEDTEIHAQCWRMLKRLGERYDIHVAARHPEQRAFAKNYADKEETMGHTATSQRHVIDRMINELQRYGRVLAPEERERFERMLKAPLRRLAPITHASSLHAWAFLLASVCLEQQREIEELRGG